MLTDVVKFGILILIFCFSFRIREAWLVLKVLCIGSNCHCVYDEKHDLLTRGDVALREQCLTGRRQCDSTFWT